MAEQSAETFLLKMLVVGQELGQHFIGRNNGLGGSEAVNRITSHGHVFRSGKRNPIERVGKKTHCRFRRGEPYR